MSCWVDVHTHLDGHEFDQDRRAVVTRSEAAGVGCIVNAATDLESCRRTLGMIGQYTILRGALGVHPSEIGGVLPDFSELDGLLAEDGVVAVGETGLDAYWDTTYLDNQKKALVEHILLAERHRLPLVVHSRNSHDQVLEILERFVREVPVVWHCFSGEKHHLDQAIGQGYYFSMGGVVTFPKAESLRLLVRSIPLDRLLLETDAPYLAPQKVRGKRNEPAYLVYTAGMIASIFSLSSETLRDRVYQNALCCFPGLFQ